LLEDGGRTHETEGIVLKRLAPAAPAILLFLLALALRGPWFAGSALPLGGDEVAYHALAVRLAEGKGFVDDSGAPTAWRTPGLPAVLSLIYRVMGPDPGVARVILVVVTSLTEPALYTLAFLLFQRREIAFLVGLSWVALPTSRHLAGALLGEPLAALFVTLGLLLAVLAVPRRSILLAGAAGLLLGYAVLIRVFLLPMLVGPLAWFVTRRAWRLPAALLVATGVILGAWGVRNALRMGTFTLSTQTAGVWQGNNAWTRGSWPGNFTPQREFLAGKYPNFSQLDEVGRSRVFVREALNEIMSNPGRTLWLLPRKILIFLSPSSYLGFDWLYAGLLPFSLLGAVHLARQPGYRHTLWLLGVPVLGVLAVCLVVFGDPRFRHPVDPVMVVLAWVGLAEVASWLGIPGAPKPDDVRGDPLQKTA